jgi:cellulose synthase (UDP-forming)
VNANTSWIARGRLFLESPWQGALQAGCNNGFIPMCIGSHYAVRTVALKEAGGLGPELAEDHSTTLLMAAAGWKGAHSIDAEAHGEGPTNFADAITQEFQWARSLVMIFLQTTPRYFRKLSTLRLKFQFLFGQLWYFLFSLAMLSMFSLPLLALLQARPFANVSYFSFLLHMAAPAIASYCVIAHIKKWGLLRPVNAKILSWEAVCFQLARWPWVLYAIIDAFRSVYSNAKLDWKVTPKKKEKAQIALRFFTPYVAIIFLTVLVFVFRIGERHIEFFYIALLNAACYLALIGAIIKLHCHENAHSESGET